MTIWYIPNIFANNGNAELRITYKPQFNMICVNVVPCAVGRIPLMPGIVYNPTNEQTNKNAISITSNATPGAPNDVSDDIPNVTDC